MLGRKTYTQEEIDSAKEAIDRQLAAYRELAKAASGSEALEGFEPPFFNHLALALDRRFVHRLRGVTGKDGTPLNELELIVESVMNNDGILRGNNVIKYVPEQSVVKLEPGDRIALSEDQFARLYKGVMAELEAKYL